MHISGKGQKVFLLLFNGIGEYIFFNGLRKSNFLKLKTPIGGAVLAVHIKSRFLQLNVKIETNITWIP